MLVMRPNAAMEFHKFSNHVGDAMNSAKMGARLSPFGSTMVAQSGGTSGAQWS